MITRSDLNMILSCVSQMLQEQHVPVASHGVVVASTWAPTDVPNPGQPIYAGTIQVTAGKTAAIIEDDGDKGFAYSELSVATTALGEQYGPVGNERAVLVPTEAGGPVVLFIHGGDDTPQAPAGERWTVHYNPAQAQQGTYEVVSYRKFTNDGKTKGDNKGGYRVLVGGYGTFQTTNGHTVALDDTGKQITLTTAGGLSLILDDNTGTIQLAGSGDTANDGIVRKSDLQAAITALAARVQSGGGVSAPTATASTLSFTA